MRKENKIMWNPFRKSKSQKLKEIIGNAVFDYCVEQVNNEANNNLKNKDINVIEFYQSLCSNSLIYITSMFDTKLIGFLNDYKYNIKRTDDESELEFIIEGTYFNLEFNFKNTPLEAKIIIKNKDDKTITAYASTCALIQNGTSCILTLKICTPFTKI